ncbi:MAG: RodZ domain-containing protein [Candidatus Omnitrophota bacterium]|jgi:transcriptional regulator with XRE-family HTH domain
MNAEQLPVGERLKKARQERGFTLEDLQKKTRVHLNILKAIEGETLTNLSPVYLKGFIKIYCKALGLEVKDYICDYKEDASRVMPRPKKDANSFFKSAGIKLNFLKPNRQVRGLIIKALIVLFSLLFIIKLSGCLISGRKQPSSSIAKPAVKEVLSAPAQASSLALPKEAMGGLSLVVSAKERCLVFVKVDGRVVFHRVLEKGRSGTWKAKERIDLSLGNASAVEIIVNGQRFTRLGVKRGQPLNNIVITEKDGLKIPR